jgi:hypothetical protein
MASPPGPKELALRAMREQKANRKPSPAELRQHIARVTPKAKIKGKKGRKR